MIIDCHAHVSAPARLWAYKANLIAHRGSHGRGLRPFSDDELLKAANEPEIGGVGHVDRMHMHGADRQLISPRPFQAMHSIKPAKIVHWFTEETNNLIARQTQLLPDKFFAVGGLPQVAGHPVEECFPELERCIRELGMVGVLLNPDPYEGTAGTIDMPGLHDRYWYPLYEKLCELDVPAHIHAAGSLAEREPYSTHFINEETNAVFNLARSDVFKDFPDLKILVAHGGGAIPYQIGRFISAGKHFGYDFLAGFRKLYFDTVLYNEESLRLLIKTVGADHCLFGTECPGVGTSPSDDDPERTWDNIKPFINDFDWLSEEDKANILGGNAVKLFKLKV